MHTHAPPSRFTAAADTALLMAVGAQQHLDIIGLHWDGIPGPAWILDTFLSPHFPVCHAWLEPLGRHPGLSTGLKRRLWMIKYFLFHNHPIMAFPRHFPNLNDHIAQHKPKLAIYFLERLAHLSFELPSIYVLEEHPPWWARGRIYSPKLAHWKRKWMQRKEQAALLNLYRQIAASKAPVVVISDEEKMWFSQCRIVPLTDSPPVSA